MASRRHCRAAQTRIRHQVAVRRSVQYHLTDWFNE
jgi:hypothetical protein